MKTSAFVACAIAAPALLAACTSAHTAPQTATPTPTISPVAQATALPGELSVLPALVRATIVAIEQDDGSRIVPLMRFTRTACAASAKPSDAAPVCRANEAAGTLVDSFSYGYCELAAQSRPDAIAAVRDFGNGTWSFFAAYHPTSSSDQFDVMFVPKAMAAPRSASVVSVDADGAITAVLVGCDSLDREVRAISSFVVPPLPGPVEADETAEAAPTATPFSSRNLSALPSGLAATAHAVEHSDLDVLLRHMAFVPVACSTSSEGITRDLVRGRRSRGDAGSRIHDHQL